MDQRGGSDPVHATSQNPRTSWLDVGQVVYNWTDHRESAVDKAWWFKQRDVYGVMLRAASAPTGLLLTAPRSNSAGLRGFVAQRPNNHISSDRRLCSTRGLLTRFKRRA